LISLKFAKSQLIRIINTFITASNIKLIILFLKGKVLNDGREEIKRSIEQIR
jgi:hypothetical protein